MNSKTAPIFFRISVAISAAIFLTLTGCSSAPKLKQVASDATEKSINTPEMAAELKKLQK